MAIRRKTDAGCDKHGLSLQDETNIDLPKFLATDKTIVSSGFSITKNWTPKPL
ncbi:MAG: hypothetical protein AAF230_03625 [Pseudomonadota bacterium]